MEIVRLATTDDVPGLEPHIEVSRLPDGSFTLATTFDDQLTSLDGPWPSGETAEQSGISGAADLGLSKLYVINPYNADSNK